MKESKKIKFNGETIEIKKIPLKKYGELVMAFENLPDVLKELFPSEDEVIEINTQSVLEKLPLLLFNLNGSIAKFLSVASGIEEEKILECSLNEALDVTEAILEINNFELIVKKVKNLKKFLLNKQ